MLFYLLWIYSQQAHSMTEMTTRDWGQPHPLHNPNILRNFRARTSDILITTAPKAGTTWMQQILHQLRTGGDERFNSIDDVVPWLEIDRGTLTWQQILAGFEQLPEPRIFKTHCTYEQTPGVDTARIILSSRDPRDCCISFYHHVMNMTEAARSHACLDHLHTFDDVFDAWITFGAWYRNVGSWWPHRNDHNVLWLRYEDMKTDLAGALTQILEFLHRDLNDHELARVLEYCSFSWMKTHADKFSRQLQLEKPAFKPGQFIRKGEIGTTRPELGPAREKAIIQKAHDELQEDCIKFLKLDF